MQIKRTRSESAWHDPENDLAHNRPDRTIRKDVTVHSSLVPVTDFADASHSKSAKSATTTVSYGIFSSENAYL